MSDTDTTARSLVASDAADAKDPVWVLQEPARQEPWTREFFAQLAADPEVAPVAAGVDRLSEMVLDSVRRRLDDQGGSSLVPVVILRGGLLMLDASRRTFGSRPWGFLLPAPRRRGEPVTIQRIDVPTPARGTTYVLMDPIVNSGQTILAALSKLESLGPVSVESVALACVFLTGRGESVIRRRYPRLEIFTVWNQLAVDRNGWVTGIGFDAGDYAVGGTSRPRLVS